MSIYIPVDTSIQRMGLHYICRRWSYVYPIEALVLVRALFISTKNTSTSTFCARLYSIIWWKIMWTSCGVWEKYKMKIKAITLRASQMKTIWEYSIQLAASFSLFFLVYSMPIKWIVQIPNALIRTNSFLFWFLLFSFANIFHLGILFRLYPSIVTSVLLLLYRWCVYIEYLNRNLSVILFQLFTFVRSFNHSIVSWVDYSISGIFWCFTFFHFEDALMHCFFIDFNYYPTLF